ncbi:MAG: chemotaxis protein CheX [Deltaproteobacteria bacterium]|nr:chemotaxis protein CheX [Deltaproteobacteria bacterium]
MPNFADADDLAKLVSSVTETMCATTFVPSDPLARGESLCGRMILLPMHGERQVNVLLACDGGGRRALAGAFFGMPPNETTEDVAEDAIRELLNMVAGQVSRALGLDLTLGLPRVATLAELGQNGGQIQDGVLLRSKGRIDLRLWIFEVLPSNVSEQKNVGKAGLFKSLLRVFTPGASEPS